MTSPSSSPLIVEDVPGTQPTYPCLLAEDGIRDKAHQLCKDYLHGAWLHIQPQQMIIKRVSGGLSNLLFYCALPDTVPPQKDEPQRLLLRLYGQVNKHHAMETLVTESVIFTLLSESQRGPRLYGVFPGGRLEEYIQARPLITQELADPILSGFIADQMAQIHRMEVPINKQPKWLWETLQRWLEEIENLLNSTSDCIKHKQMVTKVRQLNLPQEVAWLKLYLMTIDSPVVFCHNDLQEGNILLKEAQCNGSVSNGDGLLKNNLVIIDYEYCSYNHRGFDFANHFCEWIYDYTNQSPPYFWARDTNRATLEQQEHFFKHYITSLESSKNYKKRKQDTIENMIEETKAFTLASHLFWAIWSVVNSSMSEITFDYWGYGETRLNAYFEHKLKILSEKLT